MQFVSERNIAKVSFLYAIIVVGVLIFSTGALFIANKYRTLNKDLAALEESFIEEEKAALKADVNSLIARINASRRNALERLDDQLRKRTQEGLTITRNLHRTLSSSMAQPVVTAAVREALRPLRFNDDKSYYFILSTDGVSILHPIDPSVEGSNLLKSRDPLLRAVSRHIIDTARSGKTSLTYEWPMPGEPLDRLYEKISAIALYEPLNWVIGTGEYRVNLDKLARANIISDLRGTLKYYKSDYYFIYELHKIEGGEDFATMLINGNRPDLEGRKISDSYLDAKGTPFRQQFMEGIRTAGEAFAVYWYKKPDGSGVGRKLAFFKLYPEWNWIVARGVYFDRLDRIIADQKSALSRRVKTDIILLCVFFLAAVSFALAMAYHFSSQLQRIFDRYRRSQEESYSQLESLHRQLKEKSRKDPLTGCANRSHFNSRLAAEMARSMRYDSPLGLILLDIDHFKRINDTYGHLAGDEVLKTLAALLAGNIRRTDLLARWGGEEFAILAPGLEPPETVLFAEKLRSLVERHRFSEVDRITCSFGIAALAPEEDRDTFLQRADNALYRAKSDGRNRCEAG